MSNLERYIAFAGDVFGFYYLPKIIGNQIAKKIAVNALDKAIHDKCGSAGASNRGDLTTQLGNELSQKRWDWWRLPRIPGMKNGIPFFGGPNIGLRWAAGWAALGETAFLMNYGLTAGSKLPWGNYVLALGLPFVTSIPFINNLGYYQKNGVLPNALRVTTENIQCNGGGGKTAGVEEEVLVTEAKAAPDSASAQMVSAAEAGGIPLTSGSLTDQVMQVYGLSASKPGAPSIGALNVKGAPTGIGVPAAIAVPPPLPTLPVFTPRPVVIMRPVLVAP